MNKGVRITLICLGVLVALVVLLLIVLYVAGSQEVTDPFPGKGIDVIDAPFTATNGVATLTWRVLGATDVTTGLYSSATPTERIGDGVTPQETSYKTMIPGTLQTVDGEQVYQASVPISGMQFVRVYALADEKHTWSQEFAIQGDS